MARDTEVAAIRHDSAVGDLPLVVAFTCGWMTLPMAFFLDGEEGQIVCPATAYLIDHPKGLALFDTGLGPRFSYPAGTTPTKPLDLMEDSEQIDARLRAIGVDPGDIRWIINSHLHSDHAGGNSLLPNATVVVQATEWDYAFQGVDKAYHQPEFDTGHAVLKVHGEHDMFGDGSVVLLPTTGHTPGHQSARVRTAGGDVVLAADCCNLRRSLDEMRLPDHVHNADDYRRTLETLRGIRAGGTPIFYGHDPEFWSAVPQAVPLRITSIGAEKLA